MLSLHPLHPRPASQVHDSLLTFFPGPGALHASLHGGTDAPTLTEEEGARREQLHDLARQLFETNRQTQILQTELISRYDSRWGGGGLTQGEVGAHARPRRCRLLIIALTHTHTRALDPHSHSRYLNLTQP